jgi:two-component system chemotaxis sensor kinase CheA
MDVVANNIEAVGGSIQVESIEGNSTTIMIKIPLTLAIIDGMNIKVGASMYTLPTTSIKESFRPKENDVFKDPDGNEMIMIRGNCYPILRLHQFYNVPTRVKEIQEGIMVMVENENKSICLFVDKLLGKQQVVVKALPDYIKRIKKVHGLAGCTLLGDGSISLILDVNGLIA